MPGRTDKGKSRFQAYLRKFPFFRASLTIECALVLPIFFFACITLISLMNAIRIQTLTDLDLSNKARKMAVGAGLITAEGSADQEQTSSSPAASGSGSVRWIDLCLPKSIPLPGLLPGYHLKVLCRARTAVWSGGGLSSLPSTSEDGNETVYITDNQAVYHTHADCTHLDLAIYQSTTSEIGKLRNLYGGRYKKCRGFPKHYSGVVYASAKGDYYYPSLNYASLKRHVHLSKRSDCGDLPECSRCRARDGAA